MPKSLVKQHDFTDCGAACLASIAAHWNLHMHISIIQKLANVVFKTITYSLGNPLVNTS